MSEELARPRCLPRIGPRARGADDERTLALGLGAVAGEAQTTAEPPAQRVLEHPERIGELLDEREPLGREGRDADGAVEPRERRADVGDGGRGDLRRERAGRTVVDVVPGLGGEPIPESRRSTERGQDARRGRADRDLLGSAELLRQVVDDHERVHPGIDGPPQDARPDLDLGDPAHVERIGHREAPEAELLAEEPGEDRPRERRDVVRVEGPVADVRGHDR